MTVTDWLETPGLPRTLLCELDYLDGDEVKTCYLADRAFTSKPDDTPANTPYDEYILDQPVFIQRMGLFGSRSTAATSMQLSPQPELEFLLDVNIYRQPVRFYLGDETWSKSAFIPIATGVGDTVGASLSEYEVRLRHHDGVLDSQIETGVFESGPNKDKPMPCCIGQCFNVTPVLEDSALHQYRVHYSAVEAITEVRDAGVPVSVTVDLQAGTFRLNQAPVGEITCDVKGAVSGSWLSSPAGILNWLLSLVGATPGTVNLPEWTVGIFLREPATVLEVVERVTASCRGYWYFDREGRFHAKQFALGTAQSALLPDDINDNGLNIIQTLEPKHKVTVNFARNYTAQTNLAGSVDAESRARYQEAYSATSQDIALSGYPNAEALYLDTDLSNQADADALKALLAEECKQRRRIYALTINTKPFSYQLGESHTFIYPGLGLSDGKTGVITAVTDDPLNEEATVELWA